MAQSSATAVSDAQGGSIGSGNSGSSTWIVCVVLGVVLIVAVFLFRKK